jgi:hypothetical protein
VAIEFQAVEAIRQRLFVKAERELSLRVNEVLHQLFPGIMFVAATVEDAAGNRVVLDCAAHAANVVANDGALQADDVPFAAHMYEVLSIGNLRASYEGLREVKRLVKAPNPAKQVETLTAIVVRESALSLEAIARELQALNRETPHAEWLDVVIVLSQGVVDYKMRIFGDDSVGGVIPPARGRQHMVPALVYLAYSSGGDVGFRDFVFLLAAQLRVFLPHQELPDATAIAGRGVGFIALCTYQYDLDGALREAHALAEPGTSFTVSGADGSPLLILWLQPWQHGNVIVAQGSLPLVAILALSGMQLPMETFPTSKGLQMSCVLELDANGFKKLMSSVGRRSRGMTVKPTQSQFTIAKMLDEGTSTPFVARLSLTPLTIRDLVFTDKQRVQAFDAAFEPIQHALTRIRKKVARIESMWSEHEAAVASGRIARIQGNNAVEINYPFFHEFNDATDELIGDLARALKKFQKVTKVFGIDIGFVFQKEPQFQRKVEQLAEANPELAAYLRAARPWAEELRLFRDELEHEMYVHPMINYARTGANVVAHEPTILGKPVREFFIVTASRTNRFVEEVLMWCYQKNVPEPLAIVEIPVADRDPHKVERFKVGLEGQGAAPWVIGHSEASFDDV